MKIQCNNSKNRLSPVFYFKNAAVVLVVISLLACAKNFHQAQFEAPNAKTNLLIAGISSDFRDSIKERLIDHYKGKANIDVEGLNQLKTVKCENYDAIIVMDECIAWMMYNLSLKSFINQSEGCKNIVVFMTTGDPEAKYRYNGVDAITSASVIGNEDQVYDKITSKVDEIISARK